MFIPVREALCKMSYAKLLGLSKHISDSEIIKQISIHRGKVRIDNTQIIVDTSFEPSGEFGEPTQD